MQQFVKMRRQVSMAESTRLVLNKSIDLLHKLSNGKLGKEDVKKEISTLLSTYFVTVYPETSRGNDPESKFKLEHFLDQAYEIIDQVESGKVPLYEAIMLMNKVVVSLKPSEVAHALKAQEKTSERDLIRFRPVSKEVEEDIFEEEEVSADRFEFRKPERQQEKVEPEVAELMDEVLKQKKALESSISHLNQSLSKIGFELRAIK